MNENESEFEFEFEPNSKSETGNESGLDFIVPDANRKRPDSIEDQQFLEELDRLQNKRTSWTQAAWILVLSVVVFTFTGASAWSGRYVAMVIPILFLHEMGHYVAMRVFKYQNVKMFFIPWFGAAVSGRHYNAPGWKQAVVALAGPVPSILFATGVGIAGYVLQIPWAVETAIVSLVINGLNLLPVLPLDGGRVLQSVLFCRHYILDAAFRALAVLGLGYAGYHFSSYILMGLAFLWFIGLRYSITSSRVASDLREEGYVNNSADDNIPNETALVIADRLKAAYPVKLPARTLALFTTNVFEALNARPPGWLASLGLLGTHVVSLAVAVIAAAGLLLLQRDFNPDHQEDAEIVLESTVDCTNTEMFTTNTFEFAETNRALFSQFADDDSAKQAFGQLQMLAPADSSLARFGQLVVVYLTNDLMLDQCLAAVSKATRTNAEPHLWAEVTVTCTPPDEETANKLQQLALECFEMPEPTRILPPWVSASPNLPQLQQSHQEARQFWRKLVAAGESLHNDPKLNAIQKQLFKVTMSNDLPEHDRLTEEENRRFQELRASLFEQLRQNAASELERSLIDLYGNWPNPDQSDYQAWLERLDFHLGPTGTAKLVAALPNSFRMVFRENKDLHFESLYFHSVSDGLHCFTQWLCENGCSDVNVQLVPYHNE